MKYIVYALAFMAELICWFTLASAGYQFGGNKTDKWILAVVIFTVVIVFWSLCMSPKAPYRLNMPLFYLAKIILYGGTTVSLWSRDKKLALLFIGILLLSEPWLIGDERSLSS